MQEAAGTWVQAKEQFMKAKNRYDQLLGYRLDYVQQLQSLGDGGCEVGRLRNRIEFIGQLDSGLSQLNLQLAQLAKARTHCEKIFLQTKAEQDAVVQLIERVKQQQDIRIDRAEQKEIDEYAQKQWYSKKIKN